MSNQTYKSAIRRYRRSFIPVIIFYVIACIAAPFVMGAVGADNLPVATLLAVLTGAPVGVIMWLMLRLSRETDEYSRLQMLESLAEGAGIVVTLSMVVGFLEMYGAIDPVWTFWVGPAFFFAYAFAAFRRGLAKVFWL